MRPDVPILPVKVGIDKRPAAVLAEFRRRFPNQPELVIGAPSLSALNEKLAASAGRSGYRLRRAHLEALIRAHPENRLKNPTI